MTAIAPKLSRGSLDIVNNTYVVQNGLLYEYYSISCEAHTEGSRYIYFDVSPGVMSPGVAIVGKRMYDVTLRDLLRRRIDVTRVRSNNDSTTSGDNTAAGEGSNTNPSNELQPDTNEQATGSASRYEISEVADMAWQDQIHTLLETLHSKEGEEFEIADTSQSGQLHEGGSIPDIFEDTEQD